jgi:hypothetical protein
MSPLERMPEQKLRDLAGKKLRAFVRVADSHAG